MTIAGRGGTGDGATGGTVTFLFTDLEASTRLWEEYPEAMQAALARHDQILRDAIAAHDGHIVKMRGDGAHAAFAAPTSAVFADRHDSPRARRRGCSRLPPSRRGQTYEESVDYAIVELDRMSVSRAQGIYEIPVDFDEPPPDDVLDDFER